jgi:hypothetical protein
VLVVDDQLIVSRRGVTLGPLVDREYAIDAGLSLVDTVIVNGQMRAIPGHKVKGIPAGSGQP